MFVHGQSIRGTAAIKKRLDLGSGDTSFSFPCPFGLLSDESDYGMTGMGVVI